MNATAEIDEAIRAALRGTAGVVSAAALAEANSPAVMQRIRFHGMAVLLDQETEAIACWPESLREQLHAEAQRQRVQERLHKAAITPVIRAWAEEGIEAVLLKGTGLAYAHYPDPAMRPRGDTDILVRDKDLGRARAVLDRHEFEPILEAQSSSYQETWQSPPVMGVNYSIDLHWRASPLPFVHSILPLDELMENTAPVPALDERAVTLEPVSLLLTCLVNQRLHSQAWYYVDGVATRGEGRLGWAYDVHLLAGVLSGEDWSRLVETAVRKRIAETVAWALNAARKAFGTAIPEPVLTELSQGEGQDIFGLYFAPGHSLRRMWIETRSAGTPLAMLAHARRHLFPSRERLRSLRPDYPDWPLLLLQLRRLASPLARSLRRRRGS